ncbi:hypothetical protein BDZ89DRAFT_1076287 [Hymenopellis radicata]|nr:hypothetical protein BDZ89DRAFT_1076287 [Hymenopellis radicata]
MPTSTHPRHKAGSSDGHDSANASPRSQQSRLSTSSSSSSSEDSHHDRRQSQYHDIGYLNTLAQSGAGDGQFRIVRGPEARHILGQYQNDAVFRHKSGPLVIARSAVTNTGRTIVDYARTWRGDTKAHRNKGPRKDFLSGEFKRAKDIQQYFEHELTTKIPEEEAAQHDQQLKHTLKEFDKEFLSATVDNLGSPSKLPHSKHPSPRHSGDKTLPPSPANKELSLTPPDSRSPRHSPSKHSESLPGTSSGHRKSSRENKHPDVNTLLPPPSSATASVQSIPRLGPILQDLAAHEQPLRIVNPDPMKHELTRSSATSFSSEGTFRHADHLVIVVLDDHDDYNDWELKHPTAVLRRTPTSRKSRWDGPLVGRGDSSEERTESVDAPKNVTPLKISPPVYALPKTFSLGTPATGYVPQVPAYTPQSIYAPPAPSPYSSYAPASGQSSPYASFSPYGTALSPFGGSTVTLSPANVGYTNQGYGPFSPYATSQASLSPPYAAAPINLTSPSYHYMGL